MLGLFKFARPLRILLDSLLALRPGVMGFLLALLGSLTVLGVGILSTLLADLIGVVYLASLVSGVATCTVVTGSES